MSTTNHRFFCFCFSVKLFVLNVNELFVSSASLNIKWSSTDKSNKSGKNVRNVGTKFVQNRVKRNVFLCDSIDKRRNSFCFSSFVRRISNRSRSTNNELEIGDRKSNDFARRNDKKIKKSLRKSSQRIFSENFRFSRRNRSKIRTTGEDLRNERFVDVRRRISTIQRISRRKNRTFEEIRSTKSSIFDEGNRLDVNRNDFVLRLETVSRRKFNFNQIERWTSAEQKITLDDRFQICSTTHCSLSAIDSLRVGSLGFRQVWSTIEWRSSTFDLLLALGIISTMENNRCQGNRFFFSRNLATKLDREDSMSNLSVSVSRTNQNRAAVLIEKIFEILDDPYICVFVKESDESVTNFIGFFSHKGRIQMKIDYDYRESLRQLICDESPKGNCICKWEKRKLSTFYSFFFLQRKQFIEGAVDRGTNCIYQYDLPRTKETLESFVLNRTKSRRLSSRICDVIRMASNENLLALLGQFPITNSHTINVQFDI